ncbi:MAG TPA: GTP cyclohydrolase I, partial [Thermomicrobiales bacterium]|nr:GTP cyclohydrolase I [Thermomicrobiales bacterium]
MVVSLDRDDDRQAALDAPGRAVSDEQMRRFERYAAEMFAAFGMDLDTPATADTPRRFVRALYDATKGYDGDPKLVTVFETECRGGADCRSSQVIEGPIHFYALCEHHALPFVGQAYVGYIPHEHIIGISKLTRVVRL